MLISGDLNYLLDREIQKVAFVPKPVLVRGGCNSTNHSSFSKSPLAAYVSDHQPQSNDCMGGPGSVLKQGGSSLSSFDDFEGVMGVGRMEVSPGKMGEGLFPMGMNEP